MGTGKTCTAVSVAEKFIHSKNDKNLKFPHTTLKNIIVLTKGKGLQNNFINEIANVCTSGNYLSNDLISQSNAILKDKRTRRNVKVNYTFETFEVFTKNLKNKSNGEKHLLYENTLFIIDEAHNLRMSSDPEERNIYREIYSLFHLLKFRKILLLTGTPMKDKVEEIVDIFNLILKDKLTIQDLNDITTFKVKIRGYVSYLRAMTSDIDRTEVGQLIGELKHFKVYPVNMSRFQSDVYLFAKIKDEEEKSIFNHSRQASSFVFPDKSYGKTGFQTHIVKTSSGYKFTNSSIQQELKQNLKKYSAKYADLIERLSNDYDNGKLSFVFSEFVKGSGLILLSLLLELNGYVNATVNTNFNRPQKRFVIFTNETSTDIQTRRLVNIFNSPKNMNGKYISTILGSKVIMEGFTFKNIQSEYILTPHWNYSETSQIIARGLRLGSHNDLIKSKAVNNLKIEIFQYVALPPNIKDSVDLHMYQIAEVKDYEIQKFVRILKETALDCELNKERNTVTNKNLNNTRTCEYTNCIYKCDNERTLTVADRRNYKLLYFKNSIDYYNILNTIVEMVKLSPITLQDIQLKIGTEITIFEILSVIEDVINLKQILFVRPEGFYYLKNNKNLFYASNNKNNLKEINEDEDPYLLKFYYRNVLLFNGKSIDELIYTYQEDFMVNLVNKVFESSNLQQLQTIIVRLPVYLQEKLLCLCISLKNIETKNNFVRDMVLNNYRLYFKIIENEAFVWINIESYKCTSNYNNIDDWKKCSLKDVQKIETMKKEREKIKMSDNPYGYIGLLNRITNDFCLKKADVTETEVNDKRKKFVGKRCQNWKKKELVDLISNKLKVNPDNENFDFNYSDVEKMKQNPKFRDILNLDGTLKDYKRTAFWNVQDINYICTKIMQDLKDKELVIDDPNCGTSKKMR